MTNPFKDSTKKMQRAESNEGLDLAVVEQVDGDESHIVFVRVLSSTSEGTVSGEPTPVTVAAPTSGDVNVPSVGDLVVIGRFKGRRPVIIGTVHSQNNEVPSYKSGERVLGHTETGSQIRFKKDGTISIDSDSGVVVDGRSIKEPVSNPLSFPYIEWTTSNFENEIWRVELDPDETLKVYRLETRIKGGSTDPDFYIDIYDVDEGRVIAQTSDLERGSPIGTSGQGSTVIARVTNNTSSSQNASISSKIAIEIE